MRCFLLLYCILGLKTVGAQSLNDQLNALLLYPNDLRYSLLGEVANDTLSVTYVLRGEDLCS